MYLFVQCAFASVLILFSSLCVTLPQDNFDSYFEVELVRLIQENSVSPLGEPPEAPEYGEDVDEARAAELRVQQLAEWREQEDERIR